MRSAVQQLPGFILRSVFAVVLAFCGAGTALAQLLPMLIQAESMSTAGSTAPMMTANDFAAMGGRYIAAPSNATTTTNPVRGASMQVNLAAGTYYLWARIAGPTTTSDALYVGIDSSWARVFPPANTPSGTYAWVKVPISNGSTLVAFDFPAPGAHDIQVAYGEVGAKLDAVYLTTSLDDTPGFAAAPNLLIEAESLNRVAPMTVGSEVTALGGQYLSPTTGTSSTAPFNEASVTLDLAANTPYFLWARIAGPNSTSDALYVGIESFARVFPQSAPAGTYEWVKVPTTDGGSSFAFSFPTAGPKTIQVGHGEINARLDALYVTTNANETPKMAPLRRVIEAEAFNREPTPPTMAVGTDPTASGSQYITTTSTENSTAPTREAWTTVDVPSGGGTYHLWARIRGETFGGDAIYVGLDNTYARVFAENTGVYEWRRVEVTAGAGFTLTAGAHEIQVGHGEVGARLDAVYVTDNAADTPPGFSAVPAGTPCAIPNGRYEGFGGTRPGGLATNGGFGMEIYVVNDLTDDDTEPPYKPGTLRDALSQPDRCIIFDAALNIGESRITVATPLNVRSNVTIDGFSAPSPGITLQKTNDDPSLNESQEPPLLNISGASNVVVRGIKIRKSPGDAIRVTNGASNVVLDHLSVTGFGDGGIDVVDGAHDVTIQWSIVGQGHPDHSFPSLFARGAYFISVHHNLFIQGQDRQPKCGGPTPAGKFVCDVRNNLIWDYRQAGTSVRDDGSGNVIKNYYRRWVDSKSDPEQTIWVFNGGDAHVTGNHSHDGFTINDNGNRTEFITDRVPATTDAQTAARAVASTSAARDGAGARGPNFGLDSVDRPFIDGINKVGIQQ